jgi:Flp pilus assembly protein TadD
MKTITVIRSPIFHFLVISLLGVLVYSNTFDVPFQFDDKNYVIINPAMRDFGYFLAPSKIDDHIINSDVKNSFRTRYVTYLSFWANYRLGGLDVTGYHVVNTAVHIINALLMYLIVRLMFRTPFLSSSRFKERSGLIALFSGLLFVCHPVQTMAVTYIYQRLASLAATFYLLSFALYVRWRLGTVRSSESRGDQGFRIWRKSSSLHLYFLSLLSCVLAMKTKENAITLPLMLVLYEFLFFAPSHPTHATGDIRWGWRVLYFIPFLLTMLIIPVAYIGMNIKHVGYGAVLENATRLGGHARLDYILSEFRGIVAYIRLLFMPVGQSIYFDDMLSHSFSEPPVFLSFLFLFFIFCFGLYMLQRSRRGEPALRLISFGIFWFFLALSVESIVPLMEVIFEYRLYLPSTGAFIAISSGVVLLAARFERLKKATAWAAVAAVIVFSGATYARNTVWQSEISLWEDTVKKAPGNPYGHYYLGMAYDNAGLSDKANEQYQFYTDLGNSYESTYNVANIYYSKGLYEKAEKLFKAALVQNPDYARTYHILGNVYVINKQYDNAIRTYINALQLYPLDVKSYPKIAETYHNLGYAYYLKGETAEAIRQYQNALSLMPKRKSTYRAMAFAFIIEGMNEKAMEYYKIAESLK